MKRNIAIIVQKLNGGGAERTASNLSFLLANKYNVHLIVFDGRNIKYPYAGELHNLKLPPVNGKLGKIQNMMARIEEVKKIKKNCEIDAAISLMDGANLVNVLSKGKEKILTSIRIQMSQSRNKDMITRVQTRVSMRQIAKKSDYVVALSKGVEKDLIDNYSIPKHKAVTIYNPCDGAMLKNRAMVHVADAAEMPVHSVTTMGRLDSQKGQWHLIRAFKKVISDIPDAQLYILGEGGLEEKLKKLTNDLGLNDNVKFLGFVEAPHAYIMKSRAFVFPSLFEGLGNVLLEAMACDTPCIASDCYSGPREIIAPGTSVKEQLDAIEFAEYGVLVSVGDKDHFNANDSLTEAEEQLAEAIKLLLTNDEMCKVYKQAAEKRIKDFTPEKITGDWVNLIEEIK